MLLLPKLHQLAEVTILLICQGLTGITNVNYLVETPECYREVFVNVLECLCFQHCFSGRGDQFDDLPGLTGKIFATNGNAENRVS